MTLRPSLAVLFSLALAGCSQDRALLIGSEFVAGAGVSTVNWNGVTEAEGFVLQYPADSTLHGEGIELYDGTTRVPLAGTTTMGSGMGGPYRVTVYDATTLPLDSYTAVHRRSSGTGDPYTAPEEAAFTTFMGVPALVTTLHVYRRPPSDGGVD